MVRNRDVALLEIGQEIPSHVEAGQETPNQEIPSLVEAAGHGPVTSTAVATDTDTQKKAAAVDTSAEDALGPELVLN